MAKKPEPIVFYDEEGFEIELEVLEQTTIAGQNYLLVMDEEVEEVLLLKEIPEEGDFVSYDIVEDDQELDSIMKVFNELVEEIDLEW